MDDKAPDAPNVHSITDASIIDVSIDTLRSNDEGVAFIVRLGDLRIYHAGDLNNWWWDGDVEDQKLADIYHEELERIRGRHFTAAFIPLDPRLNGWWKGIEDFTPIGSSRCITSAKRDYRRSSSPSTVLPAIRTASAMSRNR